MWELVVGSSALAVMSAACLAWPAVCVAMEGPINFAAYTCIHVLLHSAVLAAAHRTCAVMGTRLALVAGLGGIVCYYLGITLLLQLITGLHEVRTCMHIYQGNN